jgi:hypothetical protein
MMSKINIENYEAFYLDYLEGNLSESEKSEFILFLENHPELKIEEENSFVFLEDNQTYLKPEFLNQLKVPDLTEKISAKNIDFFLVGEIENQLSENKKIELNDYVKKNPILTADRKLYQKVKLTPNLNIKFSNKNQLKKGQYIYLYRTISIAASVLFIIGLMNFLNHSNEDVVFASVSKMNTPKLQKNNSQKSAKETTHFLSEENTKTDKLKKVNDSNSVKKNSITKIELQQNFIISLDKNELSNLEIINSNRDIEKLNFSSLSFQHEADISLAVNNKPHYTDVAEMKNPIKLITNKLQHVTKREIDFRTAKATSSKQGGFYLKIGKLEITRKTYKEEDALALQ